MADHDIATVRAFIDSWRTLDLEKILAFFTPDAVYANAPIESAHGVAAIRAMLLPFVSMTDKAEWTVLSIASARPGMVLTERIDRFHIGDRWVEMPVMGAFELVEEKISAWRDYWDLGRYTSQLPAVPA